jgi:hypothetical protein
MIFVKQDKVFHLLQIDFIVEANDIFGLSCLLVHHTLSVNLSHIFLAREQMSVVVDDRVEGDCSLLCDFGNGVDRAHHQLVEMPVHQKLRLAAEHRLYYEPHYLLALFGDLKHLAKLNRGLSTCLEHSPKEEVVR